MIKIEKFPFQVTKRSFWIFTIQRIWRKMRKDEAEKVIGIILECDGGCSYCVSGLLKLFTDEFPEHKDVANMIFRDKFDTDLEGFLNLSPKDHKK